MCCQRPSRPTPVPDLRVPRDGADRGIAERLDEPPQRLRLEDRVAVDHHDDRSPGRRDPRVEGRGLATVLLAQHADPLEREPLGDLGRAVGRAVVHDDDLEVRVVARRERADGTLDPDRLVVRRNDDRDRRQVRGSQWPPPLRAKLVHGETEHEHDAGGEEERDEADDELEHTDEREPEADGRSKDHAAAALPRGSRRRDRARVQARELGDGDEPEPALPQARDQARERRDGLAPVTAAVVEHHDPARGPGRARVAHGRRHASPAPVLGVVVGQDDEVTLPGERGEGALVARRHGVGGRRVGRPHEPRVATGDPGDHRLGQVELEPALPAWAARERDMGEGVVAELVAVAREHADEVWMAGGLTADDEERGRHALTAQHGGDFRRPARIGPVVEGEGDATAGWRLRGDEMLPASGQHRPSARKRRRPAELLEGRPAHPDRVRGDALEQDRDGGDDEAEGEQAPVRRWLQPPECGLAAHYGLRGEVDVRS